MRALLPIPQQLKRFYLLPADGDETTCRFISMEALLTVFSARLFPGYNVVGEGVFRVIRDSDIEIEEEAEENLS